MASTTWCHRRPWSAAVSARRERGPIADEAAAETIRRPPAGGSKPGEAVLAMHEASQMLGHLVAGRGTAPRFIRCDNGPELTANALRDWCRFTGAGTSYSGPRSPWQNPYVESFGSRLRDELLAVEAFSSLLEAQVLVEDWRIEYNTVRSHCALGYLTPSDFTKAWTINQPALSSGWTNNRGPVKQIRDGRQASVRGVGPAHCVRRDLRRGQPLGVILWQGGPNGDRVRPGRPSAWRTATGCSPAHRPPKLSRHR
jgi:Integrase core domain